MASKKVTLKSSDGEMFLVDEAVAMESLVLKYLIEDVGPAESEIIPIFNNVNGAILSKIIAYCKKHVEVTDKDELKAWDAEFMKVGLDTLLDLLRAADYLNIKNLLDLTAETVTNMIYGKTPKGIAKTLNIKDYLTLGEKEEIQRKKLRTVE